MPPPRSRWLTGWTLTGMAATPIFSYAMNASSSHTQLATASVMVGGAVAASVGASVAAKQAGRNPRADATIAAVAYVIAAALFLALLSTGTSQEYNTYSAPASENRQFDPFLYTIYALALFGSLFGIGMGKYYSRSMVRLALACSAVAVLAGVSMFLFALCFAGYNILTPWLGQAKVPVGLALGGFLGALVPGRIVESLLDGASRL